MTGLEFCAKLKPFLPRGVSITKFTLSRYEGGCVDRPTPAIVSAIERMTNGKITYADLCKPVKPARRSAKRT